MKFNLDEYEPVESRIFKFYERHTGGRITTELVSGVVDIPTIAVFKAYAYDGDILLATGYAMERQDDGYVNKNKHVENCETSAIGRALANMGLSGSKRPSREEMDAVQRAESNDTERIQKGKNEINQLLDDNRALLLPEYIRAVTDNAESVKTLEDVKEVYRELKKTIQTETAKESKVRTADNFTETATRIFKGTVVSDTPRKKIPDSLAKAIKERDAGKGEKPAPEKFVDDSAEIVGNDDDKQTDIF